MFPIYMSSRIQKYFPNFSLEIFYKNHTDIIWTSHFCENRYRAFFHVTNGNEMAKLQQDVTAYNFQ